MRDGTTLGAHRFAAAGASAYATGPSIAATTSNNAFVFSRANASGKYELFVWDPTNGVRSISNTGLTHTHVANYALDNR